MTIAWCFIKADLRQKNLLFWDWIFPFILLTLTTAFIGRNANNGEILGGLLSFLLLQSIIFGIPFRLGEYIERGTLQLMAEEGNHGKFMMSFLLSRCIMAVIQFFIFLPVGALVMDVSLNLDIIAMIITLFVGLLIIGGIAMFISSLVKKQQEAFGYAQMIYISFATTSGIFYPLEQSPDILKIVSKASPLTYINNSFGQSITTEQWNYSPLIVITIIGGLLMIMGIKQIDKRLNGRSKNVVPKHNNFA